MKNKLKYSFLLLLSVLAISSCGTNGDGHSSGSAPSSESGRDASNESDEDYDSEDESGEDESSESSSVTPKYKVKWVNDNGKVIEEDEGLEYGEMPSYDGDIPTKSGSESYYYSFVGWKPKVAAVTKDITYTASYKDISDYDSYGLSYTSVSGGYNVSAGNAKYFTGTIIIPKTHKGQRILGIDSSGFSNCLATRIVIPNTISAIPNNAFSSCLDLKEIIIPDSIQSVGSNAFSDCDDISELTFGSNLRTISSYAFSGCTGLTKITFNSSSLQTVESSVFRNCLSLKRVAFPSSVTSIGSYIFDTCISLESITIPFPGPGTGSYSSYFADYFGYTAFDDSILINSRYIPKSLTTIIVNGSGYEINSSAFSGLKYLENIEVYGAGGTLGSSAFSGCENLTSITLSSGIEEIRENAFFDCEKLKTFDASNSSITKLGDNIFNGCSSLVTVKLPSCLQEIGNYTFRNCSSLKNINIPDSVEKIGRAAFSNCDNLSYNSYEGAYYLGNDENPYVLLVGVKNKDITSFTINPQTKIIGDFAFYDCVLLSSIEIPDNIISIGYNAFQNCVSLNSVTIGSGVKSIYGSAFFGCSNILELTIPRTVENVYPGALSGLSGLRTLTTPVKCATNASHFGSLFGTNSYEGSSAANSYYIPDSLQTVNFNKSMTEFGGFNGWKTIQRIIVPKGVTTISSSAFSGCTGLITIDIPNTLTRVDYYAFQNCTNLSYVNYEGSSYDRTHNISIETYASGNTKFTSASWSYYTYGGPTE